MKLIKRHMGLAIISALTLILLIILFIIFSRMTFSNKKGEYGDRLNNIVKISESTIKEIKSKIIENEEVEKTTIRKQGKIIYTTITFSEKTTKDKAKEIASKSLEYFDEDVVACYDFEFILTQDPIIDENSEEKTDKAYTIAGNKSPNNENISWTRN